MPDYDAVVSEIDAKLEGLLGEARRLGLEGVDILDSTPLNGLDKFVAAKYILSQLKDEIRFAMSIGIGEEL
jgi:hypothetical protein